jgi:phospholipid/cholesterol/gamma-HCH transport system permease protein
MTSVANLGRRVIRSVDAFGAFCRFCALTFGWILPVVGRRRSWHSISYQFYQIGTRSVPVVMITGAFVGAVLAVQTVTQFKAIGMIDQMGAIVNLSVLRELGPVLAGVMLAGRVGGGLTAELGTMRVTEQIDALRAMGADPIRVLVVPRFLACVLLIPILAMYGSFTGILGGYAISVYLYGVNSSEFWSVAAETVRSYDILYGPIKCLFFGGVTSLICCFMGFTCKPGAAGVGRACTESFVASCMAILGLDFFLGMTMNTIIEMIWGVQVFLM